MDCPLIEVPKNIDPSVQRPVTGCPVTTCMWNGKYAFGGRHCNYGNPATVAVMAAVRGLPVDRVRKIRERNERRIVSVLTLDDYSSWLGFNGRKIRLAKADMAFCKSILRIEVYKHTGKWNVYKLLIASSLHKWEEYCGNKSRSGSKLTAGSVDPGVKIGFNCELTQLHQHRVMFINEIELHQLRTIHTNLNLGQEDN